MSFTGLLLNLLLLLLGYLLLYLLVIKKVPVLREFFLNNANKDADQGKREEARQARDKLH